MRKQVAVIYPKGSLGPNGHRNEDKRMAISVDVYPGEKDFSVLEKVFRAMNRVDGSEIEQQLDDHQERSMMAGDKVELNGKVYEVDMIGFKRI